MKSSLRLTIALVVSLLMCGALLNTASATPVKSEVATVQAAAPAVETVTTLTSGSYLSNGDYWWTAWVYASPYGLTWTGNDKFSWSHMWYIKTHMATNSAMAGAVCMAIPNTQAKAACTAYAIYVGVTVNNKVNHAIANKKCLQVRFGLPPYPIYAAAGWWEVTCLR